MSIHMTLYKNRAEIERLDKSDYLSGDISLNGTLREETSVIQPRIKVQAGDITEYNYAYITEFHRYYFIRNITSIRNNLWEIELECDVLMSYKDKILQQTGIIDKQESDPVNKYFNDGTFPVTEEQFIKTIDFPEKLVPRNSSNQPTKVWLLTHI